MSISVIFLAVVSVATASYHDYIAFMQHDIPEPRLEVLADVPIIWGGFDPVEYFKTNRAHKGSSKYALNITSKDDKGIARVYQVHFQNEGNMNQFKNNQS
eukprot:820135_1